MNILPPSLSQFTNSANILFTPWMNPYLSNKIIFFVHSVFKNSAEKANSEEI